jgi:hypothetical protein
MVQRSGARLALAVGLWLAATPGLAEGGSAAAPDAAAFPEEAAAPAADADPGDWQISLAAYAWVTDLTGTLAVRDTTVDVDPQLWNDILKNVDGALAGGVEASYRGRWLLNLDLFGSLLSSHAERGPFPVSFGPRTFTRDLRGADLTIPVETRPGTIEVPVRVDPGTLRVDVPRVETAIGPFDVDVKQLMVFSKAQVGYRVVDAPALELLGHDPGDDPRRLRVDLFAGLRYWYLKAEVDIESPPIEVPEFTVTSSLSGGRIRVGGDRVSPRTQAIGTVRLPGLEFGPTTFGGTDVDEDASAWWIDPVVGLRVGADLTERISFLVAGNVGGFGIGSASTFSWEALAALDWRFGETTSAVLGYRALGVDRRGSNVAADITLHGPVLGVVFRY